MHQQQLRSKDAGTFSVPVGKEVEKVHVYIRQNGAQHENPEAVKFSKNSVNLFNQLAAEASKGLPNANSQLPQLGQQVSQEQVVDRQWANRLGKQLGAISYEEDRFHFAPERGPDFQGR